MFLRTTFGIVFAGFLPGAGPAYALRGKSLTPSLRFAFAVTLSPLLVLLEFLALRLLGLEPRTTAWAIAALASLSLIPIVRRLRGSTRIDARFALASGLVLLPASLFLVWRDVFSLPWRLTLEHSWMHLDAVYQIAAGGLDLENPECAGVRFAYHWLGHMQSAVVGILEDRPPVSNAGWMNLLDVIAVAIFVQATLRELGCGRKTGLAAIALLFFGLQFAGLALEQIVGPERAIRLHLAQLGWRYSPWIWKAQFFTVMPPAFAAGAAAVWGAARVAAGKTDRSERTLLFLALAAGALVYPVLTPPAVAVLGLAGLAVLRERRAEGVAVILLSTVGLAIALAAAHHLMRDVAGSMMAPRSISRWPKALFELGFAGLLYLPALAAAARPARSLAALILLLGAAVPALFFCAISIGGPQANEYKFMFAFALAAAPATAAMLSRRIERTRPAVLVGLFVVLVLPFGIKFKRGLEQMGSGRSAPDDSVFALEVPVGDPLRETARALRERSPRDAVVLAERSAWHLPTLLHRSLLAPPRQSEPHPGYLFDSRYMLEKAHQVPAAILDHREALRDAVFGADAGAASAAMDEIAAGGRPLAVIVETGRRKDVAERLAARPGARLLHADESFAVWLLPARAD